MKRIVLSLIVVLLISAILCSCTSKSQNTGAGASGISLEEFNQLSMNMSYNTACEIIGGKGTLISETQSDEPDYIQYTLVYRFDGEINGYAEIEFTHYGYKDILDVDIKDYLTAKTQYDLE